MRILTNKYFILGNLLLLLISIPVTLFFIKRQQELRGRAAPSSRLSFVPSNISTSTQCQSFTTEITLDPGSNIVSIVDFYITYDPTKLDVTQIKESERFPTVVRAVSVSSGEANMSVSVGADVTRAVQTVTKVATITFRPKASGTAQIVFDQERSRVFSLAPQDEPTENVLFQVSPANVTIGTGACLDAGLTPTATPTPSLSPAIGGGGGSPTPTPTQQNQSPVCTDLSVSPSATGSAPFSTLFTAKGNDPDATGTLTKVTFNYGDGQVQDITEGLGQRSATIQANHTYQNAGTFNATAAFTDNVGAVSQSCSQTVTATGSATITPTPTSTQSAQATPTPPPTAAPTIPPTGGLATTIGIIGAALLIILGGLALLTL